MNKWPAGAHEMQILLVELFRFAAQQPTETSMPADRKCAKPFPETFGLGSSIGATTRLMPALISASVQGGVRPWCA